MNREELEALIVRWSDGSLGEDEVRELDRHLRDDAEARALFRRHVRLDTALHEWAEARATDAPWPAPGEKRTPLRRIRWALVAAAAMVLWAATAWFFYRPAPPAPAVAGEHTAQGCAVLAQMLDATFPSAVQPIAGDTLRTGRFQLTGGFAQIEFFSGATVLVEGAAELELVSAWEARCVSGKVRVRVPPAARGFRLHVPEVKLVDLGTEFAVNVGAPGSPAEVHVFDGEVVAEPAGLASVNLKQGQSLRGAELASLDPQSFLGIGQLQELVGQRQDERFQAAQAAAIKAGKDPRVVACYLFQHFPQWERLVKNARFPYDRNLNGGAVGATWTQGRWPQKGALEFKRPGARVRLNIDGTYEALTFTCWAKVDALDRKYNALLLTDGYDAGEPHWQIYEDGRLMFSVAYPDPSRPDKKRNQIYYSPPILTPATGGRWHHFAVTYDTQSGEAVQYMDGRELSREVSEFHQPGRHLVIGPCELGNWGLPTEGHKFPIRNLNGSLDEFFIYRAALSGAEIQALYQAGRPE